MFRLFYLKQRRELVQICIAKCLYSYRDDLSENLGKTTAREREKSPLPVDGRRSETSLLNLPFILVITKR